MRPNFIESITKKKPVKAFALFTVFLVLVAVWLITAHLSYQKIGTFGCFDQCFNFVAAYFILKGKTLFSQIFFNHQPLMAYFSYFLQSILQPDNLYQLVLYHRLSILAFSLLMNIFLILRFRWVGIGFVLFYEMTKFYLFGNFFLPEAMITYPFAYLIGLLWESFQKKKLFLVDYLLGGIFTWLIIFLREPYIPLALVIYIFLIFSERKNLKLVFVSLTIFITLSLLTLLNLPLRDYFYDVFTVNLQAASTSVEVSTIQGLSFFKIFLYPFLILLSVKQHYFWLILTGLDIIFLAGISWLIISLKKFKRGLFIFFILGLAAVRFVEPGTVFYKAFHLLVWYSLFLMLTFLFLREMFSQKKNHRLFLALTSFLAVIFIYTLFSPQSLIWEKTNREEEFTTNYAPYFANGEVIRLLSKPGDYLFLDMWDDLIYWQSGLDSSYQYSLYTPIMTNSQKFKEARLTMFRDNPPDFYYSYYGAGEDCLPLLPEELVNDYAQLYFGEKPSCLCIRKENLAEISANQWQEVKKLGFFLPIIED